MARQHGEGGRTVRLPMRRGHHVPGGFLTTRSGLALRLQPRESALSRAMHPGAPDPPPPHPRGEGVQLSSGRRAARSRDAPRGAVRLDCGAHHLTKYGHLDANFPRADGHRLRAICTQHPSTHQSGTLAINRRRIEADNRVDDPGRTSLCHAHAAHRRPTHVLPERQHLDPTRSAAPTAERSPDAFCAQPRFVSVRLSLSARSILRGRLVLVTWRHRSRCTHYRADRAINLLPAVGQLSMLQPASPVKVAVDVYVRGNLG